MDLSAELQGLSSSHSLAQRNKQHVYGVTKQLLN